MKHDAFDIERSTIPYYVVSSIDTEQAYNYLFIASEQPRSIDLKCNHNSQALLCETQILLAYISPQVSAVLFLR